MAQWLNHSLANDATRERFPMSECCRDVVAHSRPVVSPGSSV